MKRLFGLTVLIVTGFLAFGPARAADVPAEVKALYYKNVVDIQEMTTLAVVPVRGRCRRHRFPSGAEIRRRPYPGRHQHFRFPVRQEYGPATLRQVDDSRLLLRGPRLPAKPQVRGQGRSLGL